MLAGAKVCELTDGFLWFVCGLYVGILTSPLSQWLYSKHKHGEFRGREQSRILLF